MFAAVFDDAVLAIGRDEPGAAAPGEPSGGRRPGAGARANRDDADGGRAAVGHAAHGGRRARSVGSDGRPGLPLRLASELEALSELPFEQLTEAQTQLLGQWLEQR